MTLTLPWPVDDERVRDNFDRIAAQFPIPGEQLAATNAVAITKTNQSIPNNVFTVRVAFDTAENDNKGDADLANNRIKVTRAGWWVVSAAVIWQPFSGGTRLGPDIAINGTGWYGSVFYPPAGGALFGQGQAASVTKKLQVNDTITVDVWQDSGVPLTCTSRLSAAWLTP